MPHMEIKLCPWGYFNAPWDWLRYCWWITNWREFTFVSRTQARSLSLLRALGICAGDVTSDTSSRHGVELRSASQWQGPAGAAPALRASACPTQWWFWKSALLPRRLPATAHNLLPALPSAAHPQGCAHEHLPCSTACRSHGALRPSSCCLSVSCQSVLGQCRTGFLFWKHRIIILTLSPHTYQQGVPPPALTHLTQQLLKRRAHIAQGLSTRAGLLVSVYFNPSICKLQHFWSGRITLLAISTQQTRRTAWEKPPRSTLHRKTHKAIPRVPPASLSPSQLHPTESSWNTN